MPYNKLAESKYRSIGRSYSLQGLQPPPEDAVEGHRAALERAGITVRVGG
jgi:hypothetical protein